MLPFCVGLEQNSGWFVCKWSVVMYKSCWAHCIVLTRHRYKVLE
jgi:hypothetical protein